MGSETDSRSRSESMENRGKGSNRGARGNWSGQFGEAFLILMIIICILCGVGMNSFELGVDSSG